MAGIGGLKQRATDRLRQLRQARPGLDHVMSGYQHYQRQQGNQLAAAITYFSFLALFPLVLLGVSITAFVLAAEPHLQTELFNRISEQVPGSFGGTLRNAIDKAIQQRAVVGVIGLVGVLLTGLGWIDNLRSGIDTVWGLPQRGGSFIAKKLADAVVLVGLGIGVVVSLGITAGGTAASGLLLRWIGADRITGAGTLTSILAILLGIAGSLLVFGWVMIRLPDAKVSRRTALRASLLAAVGFEILKIVGTFYIARVTKSPAASVIGPALGILIWINLVSRFLLFCVAWAATARDVEVPLEPALVAGPPVELAPRRTGVSPAGVAAGLLSAGATLGAATVAVLQARRSRSRDHQPPQP
ncbi:MAG: YihY/virulence factor BrkB family protein [Actinomycetota bacterium]|nr:YihY/virulence factor BrkB family protein [Actinomycetota bacterium]MDQ2955944.1 YihY/virulence factor BrkB family protein [Actinomycetota bacterium]